MSDGTTRFAIRPFQADGREFVTGENVSGLPEGTLQSLERVGYVSTTEPPAPQPQTTPIGELDLPEDVIEKLIFDGISTVEGLEARIEHGPTLTDIKDIGKATEEKIVAAVDAFRSDAGDE